MHIQKLVLLALSTTVLSAGCSAVLPLGDEYTFDDVDGSTPDLPDSGLPEDGGPVDMFTGCDPMPTMAEVCVDRCGALEVCGETFTCGECAGELSCGASTANVCGCTAPPCALTTFTEGDAADQRLVAMAVDSDGSVFLAGHFRGTMTFGAETYGNPGATRFDIFLVKLDPSGSVLWSRAYAGVGDDAGTVDQTTADLAVDAAGNVILVGKSSGPVDLGGGTLNADSDIILVKLSPDGDHIFSATYGTESGIHADAVAIDPASQDIYLTGHFYGTLSIGSLSSMTAATPGGYFDIFVASFQPDGTPIRAKKFGDPNEQTPEAIAVSGSNVYLSGMFTSDFNFGSPNPTTLSSSTFYSMFLTKLGSFFSHTWSRQFGTEVYGTRLAADPAGNLFVSGGFTGSLDIDSPALSDEDGETFFAALDPEGNTVWANQLAGAFIDDLVLAADGTLYVAGTVSGDTDLGAGPVTYSGSRDAFVAHYGADGSHLWSRVFDAPLGNQYARGVGVGSDGRVWLGMEFEGQVDPGTGNLVTQGGYDIQATRYEQ